jgi:hypothetical protein
MHLSFGRPLSVAKRSVDAYAHTVSMDATPQGGSTTNCIVAGPGANGRALRVCRGKRICLTLPTTADYRNSGQQISRAEGHLRCGYATNSKRCERAGSVRTLFPPACERLQEMEAVVHEHRRSAAGSTIAQPLPSLRACPQSRIIYSRTVGCSSSSTRRNPARIALMVPW